MPSVPPPGWAGGGGCGPRLDTNRRGRTARDDCACLPPRERLCLPAPAAITPPAAGPPKCLFKPTHCSANWITFHVKIDLLKQQQRRQIKTAVTAKVQRGAGSGRER